MEGEGVEEEPAVSGEFVQGLEQVGQERVHGRIPSSCRGGAGVRGGLDRRRAHLAALALQLPDSPRQIGALGVERGEVVDHAGELLPLLAELLLEVRDVLLYLLSK